MFSSFGETCNRVLSNCLCINRDVFTEHETKLARLIQKGDASGVERILKRIKNQPSKAKITVRRRHLSTAYPCLVDHRATGTDPFINFYQECSLVIWAVDCLQWQMLPLLSEYGYDANRPQYCRRWTHVCAPNARPNTAPYMRFWTRGRYTYQSALDYFFASVYELVGEQPQNYNGLSGPSPLAFYFSHLPGILTKGLDVHRIDSVIVFNSFADSFDRYLCRYTNEHAIVPDIPEHDDAFVELTAVKRLIEHGFSQFGCLEYLYPYCNWFGILCCLVCHPQIHLYSSILPPIVRQAALLLINLLSLCCAFPPSEDFKECLEHLHLRKVYSKRYSEKRELFSERLKELQQNCESFLVGPFSLKILARNKVRRMLGGKDFARKVASLNIPVHLSSYIQYIGQEHVKSATLPNNLVKFALGEPINGWPSDNPLGLSIYTDISSTQSRAFTRSGRSSTRTLVNSMLSKLRSMTDSLHSSSSCNYEGSHNCIVPGSSVSPAETALLNDDPTRPYLSDICNRQQILRRGRASERQRPRNIPLWPHLETEERRAYEMDHIYYWPQARSKQSSRKSKNDEAVLLDGPQRPRSAPLPRMKINPVN